METNPQKKRVVASFHNLSPELQDALKRAYPHGFGESMMRIDKPDGSFFYTVPFETDQINYLVKIDVKVDDRSEEDDEKDYYDDIDGSDGMREDNNSDGDDDSDD